MEINDIKNQLTLSTVIKHYGLKADKHNRICCPFHEDKTPSMQLYWKTHTAYCFSAACTTYGKSIDVIDFMMNMEKLSKHEAILKAQTLIDGKEIPQVFIAPVPTVQRDKLPSIARTAVLTKMFTYFKNAVHNSKPAEEYIKSRCLDYVQIEIGYNSGQFHHGARKEQALIQSCLEIGLLKDDNLVSRTGDKAYKPFGKWCIVFALRDKHGQVTGLYFRSILNNEDKKHYYLENREGLYPHYPLITTKKLILTEAIIDAANLLQLPEITVHYSILACYGTNGLTAEHRKAIKELKHLQEIVFAFDGDPAGREAAEKYSRELNLLLPDIKLSTLKLPEGEDINSLLQGHDAEIIQQLLKERELFFSPDNYRDERKVETEKIPEPVIFLESVNIKTNGHYPQEPVAPPIPTPPTKQLITTNPEQLSYQSGNLHITLLGGISLQHLDRMRVTIKMTIHPQLSSLHSIRHNIDLYQDDIVEKFVRRAAEKLEMGTSLISQAIAELVEALEHYRLSQIESMKTQVPKKKELTGEEIRHAKVYLEHPKLMENTSKDLGLSGIVGESINCFILYMAMTSRKCEEPLSVVCLGSSGSGKSYLQEKVAECIPEEDTIENTQFSENSFYYFKREEIKGKLFLIEDLDGAENVLYPIRELQSKKRISKTVTLKDIKGNLRTITLVVEGPVSVCGCTTREKIYEDNANRSILLYLDNSKEQDACIMDYQKRFRSGDINRKAESEKKALLKNCQRMLKQVTVLNPYAKYIDLPVEIFTPRRTIGLLFSFIDAITFYHQHQLEIKYNPDTGGRYIETTPEHIEWAFKLLKDVLFRKSDELTGGCRNFFEALKAHLSGTKSNNFYGSAIRKTFRLEPRTLSRYLRELSTYGLISISGGNKYRKGYEYQITSHEEYAELRQSIDTKISGILQRISQACHERTKKQSAEQDNSRTGQQVSHSNGVAASLLA